MEDEWVSVQVKSSAWMWPEYFVSCGAKEAQA